MLRLDFDFAGHGGWAVIRQSFPVAALPANYELRMQVRGAGAVNDLEAKLVDSRSENVWWWTRRGEAFPATAAAWRFKKRQLSFA